ncbi:MAG TPA: SAM-dependent methyltransferase [Chthoniobacterales bacterium]|nr:SAM-dependent methyltransferase [Chthoniobacterales bacterium]
MNAGNPALIEFVRNEIRGGGPVSFAWFMEQALYHPEFGYYSSGRCQIGRHGDYFTNASVGPLFGRLLAAQFAEMWELLGRPGDFVIVEQGAHHGDFARDALSTARERSPDFFAALQYRIVEPFSVLQDRQRGRLEEFRRKMAWEKSLDEMAPFHGVHFSNELLDAMPVHLIARKKDNSGWQERLVGLAGDEFVFVERPIDDQRLRLQIEKLPPIPTSPYETEVNVAALNWVASVSRKLTRGFVLAVDYGYARGQFYAAERSSGTLQSYAGHRTLPSPLRGIGEADITAHVDWTSIAERAEECGFTLNGFTDQYHFVTGLVSRLAGDQAAGEAAPSTRRALQTLLHPELLGTRFQYLALGKDAPADRLSGFCLARDARCSVELSD